jgi:amidase
MSGFQEYGNYDGLGLAKLVRDGKVTSLELVDEAISRIESVNPQLNAVIHKMYDRARAVASGDLPDGPLRGVPFLLKDLLASYAGEPMRSGSRFLKDYVPNYDSEMVKRYKASGLVTLGKTNTPEFGIMAYTEPELFGPTYNPWDLSRTPGGSSGGSGAAVASGMVPLAGGGDGGGSIRIPASCCGIFGLKPTRGRTPTGPVASEYWHGLVVEHVLTRSVRDSAATLDAIRGPDAGAPYYPPPQQSPYLGEVDKDPSRLRIAFTHKPFLGKSVHPDCIAGLDSTVSLLQGLGHELVEDTPQVDGKSLAMAYLTMLTANIQADIEEYEKSLGRKATAAYFETATWALALLGRRVKAVDLAHALRALQHASRTVGRFFDKYDVLLTPTLSEPPILIGSLQLQGAQAKILGALCRLNASALIELLGGIEATAEEVFAFVPYTPLINFTGQPAMSVPLHWNEDGLPIGMHFVGRYADEATLFQLAGQLERAQPWFDKRPPNLAA